MNTKALSSGKFYLHPSSSCSNEKLSIAVEFRLFPSLSMKSVLNLSRVAPFP